MERYINNNYIHIKIIYISCLYDIIYVHQLINGIN